MNLKCSFYYPRCTYVVEARLVHGRSPFEGLVQVSQDSGKDDWGFVCDDGWDNKEATVVCRSLGYPGTVYYLYQMLLAI